MLYQGMVCLAGNQTWWTAEVEEVFRKIKQGNKRAMKEYLESQNRQLDDLVNKVRSELSNNDRLKFKTIATIDVHARDIIEAFVRNSVLDAQDFGWESQLRFYWVKETDNLQILQCTGRFDYGYEYMGLNGRLVITPLTDRIYLTITQALTMNLGGAPAGKWKHLLQRIAPDFLIQVPLVLVKPRQQKTWPKQWPYSVSSQIAVKVWTIEQLGLCCQVWLNVVPGVVLTNSIALTYQF